MCEYADEGQCSISSSSTYQCVSMLMEVSVALVVVSVLTSV